jgi:uncharacterized glyoxalase superfamily protein PhnB
VRMAGEVYPFLTYRDARAAIEWLEKAFGFGRHLVVDGPDGSVVHAELTNGEGMVMLASEREDGGRFGHHAGQGWLYVVVADADAHHERARRAGAEIVMEPTDQVYGSRDYSARDPEGNLWSFGTYRPEAP